MMLSDVYLSVAYIGPKSRYMTVYEIRQCTYCVKCSDESV